MKALRFGVNIPIVFLILSFATILIKGDSQNTLILLIAGTYFLYLVLSTGKVVVKDIDMIVVLFIILVLGIVGSLIHINEYNLKNIIRDIFYILNPIVFIWTGIMFKYKYKDKYDVYKLIVYIAVVSSILNLIQIAAEPRILQVSSIYFFRRYIVVANAYTILIAIVLLFTNHHVINECNFGKIRLNLFRIICIVSFVIDFSRTNYISIFIILLPFILPSIKKNIFKVRIVFYLLAVLFVVNIFLPNLMDTLWDKITNSIYEVSSTVNWNDSSAIVNNWRGYEIYKAESLFSQANVFEQIFGFGLGRLIPIGIFSELVKVSASEGGITILHNGYYMMLIKCGFVGVLLYAGVYLVGIRKMIIRIKYNKRNDLSTYEPMLLLGICVSFLFSTYVTTGIINNGTDFMSCFLIGYLSYCPLKKCTVKNIENKNRKIS